MSNSYLPPSRVTDIRPTPKRSNLLAMEAGPPNKSWIILLAIVIAIDDMHLSEEQTCDVVRGWYTGLVNAPLNVERVREIYGWCKNHDHRDCWSNEEATEVRKALTKRKTIQESQGLEERV